MEVHEFEKVLTREIQNFLNGTNKKSRYYEFEIYQVLRLDWVSEPDTSNEIQVNVTLTLIGDKKTLEYCQDMTYTYRPDAEKYASASCSLIVPQSEEEHFQRSTVTDVLFEWEFYQYIQDVFANLRGKPR